MCSNYDGTETIVSLRNVHKTFGTFAALSDVTLDVRAGEVVVLLGPSGSGKSTLLRVINGLERHDSGHVTVAGIETTGTRSSLRQVRRRVGMVFQQFNLFPHLTVRRNVTLALRKVLRLPDSACWARGAQMLERVHVLDQAEKFPSQLSGGQQQRVAIARALALEPEVMLFDEPTSALDVEMIREVLDVMRDLARDGMTMLVVSHELGFAREVADRALFMDGGRIVESAVPDQLLDSPQQPRTQEFLSKVLGTQRVGPAERGAEAT